MPPVRSLLSLRSLTPAMGMLLVLLQRTPVVRFLLAPEGGLAGPVGQLLRCVIAPAAALGTVHTLVGASTQLVANTTLPAKATVGQPFSVSVAITGRGVSFAQSWEVTNTLPPGVTPEGAVQQGGFWVVSPSKGTLTLSGTPTAAGTFSFTAQGYQYTGRTGPVTRGSTAIVVAAAANSAPTITRQPQAQAVPLGGTISLAVSYTGFPVPTFQWKRDGTVIAGATGPTLVLSNVSAADAGSYGVTIGNALGTVTSASAVVAVNGSPAAPVFAAAPLAQSAAEGGAVVLSVDVSGVPAPKLQWLKDGTAVPGATAATLILNDVRPGDAGVYAVEAGNASGTVTSAGARLTVNAAATTPVFAVEPAALIASRGGTVVLRAEATGSPSPSYQWQRDGSNLPGATQPLLALTAAAAADAGSYTVVATNSSGVVVSPPAVLTLIETGDPGRLVNLSILTSLAANESMAIGTVAGGAGAVGDQALLARAAGPSLLPLGVTGVLPDPQITLLDAPGAVLAANNDWSGAPELTAAFGQVGAFGFLNAASRDAAILQPALGVGSYTLQVRDAGGGAGAVLAELYDATPRGSFTPASPRLINVSVLKNLLPAETLSAGFVIDGSTAGTVLVRAIGPGLAAFGVPAPMADPQMTLFGGSNWLAENDNWGGDPALAAAGGRVGAFNLAPRESKDAMLLITLAPGSYSVRVNGGSGGGAVLVEVYAVP